MRPTLEGFAAFCESKGKETYGYFINCAAERYYNSIGERYFCETAYECDGELNLIERASLEGDGSFEEAAKNAREYMKLSSGENKD